MFLFKFILSLPRPEGRERSGCPPGGLAKEELGTNSPDRRESGQKKES